MLIYAVDTKSITLFSFQDQVKDWEAQIRLVTELQNPNTPQGRLGVIAQELKEIGERIVVSQHVFYLLIRLPPHPPPRPEKVLRPRHNKHWNWQKLLFEQSLELRATSCSPMRIMTAST